MKTELLCISLIGLATTGCEPGDCGAAAPRTVQALVPMGQTVTCENRKEFDTSNGTVALTMVHYGVERDCPSGCFNATVCAIEDNAGVHLFYGGWYAADEVPTGMPSTCAAPNTGETWPDCEPPGLVHPVTETPAFTSFAQAEFGQGPFRHCINRYVGPGLRFGEAP